MNSISRKKKIFKINAELYKYLAQYNRLTELPVQYDDLLRYDNSITLYDKNGKDTLWESVIYSPSNMRELNRSLTMIYALLKAEGEISVMEHLKVDRVDYCSFGNSNPFRVKIINQINDNHDYFYVKIADSSRVFGLELEHILSPNRISYIVHDQTLIEEHIAGIPGDQFIFDYIKKEKVNKVRIAKEFVKFNERCFARLLGDMRAYNYVVDITPDFDEVQYRIRAIDFDQQSYEGKKTLYLPQYFKENVSMVELCIELLSSETVLQYQKEERTLMRRRLISSKYRMKDLVDVMRQTDVSIKNKVFQLRKELSGHHTESGFMKCNNMGDIVRMNLKAVLT